MHNPGSFQLRPTDQWKKDSDGNWQAFPMASGQKLTIAPETAAQTMVIESKGQPLQLLDGRFYHNNGWFVVRSLVTPGENCWSYRVGGRLQCVTQFFSRNR